MKAILTATLLFCAACVAWSFVVVSDRRNPPQTASSMRVQSMKTTNWMVRDPVTDEKFWVLPNNVGRLQDAITRLESIKSQAEAP